MRWTQILRIALVTFFLYVLFKLGLPISYILLIGLMFLAFLLIRSAVYSKIERMLHSHIVGFGRLPDLAKKMIIIAVIIMIYLIAKQALYELLKIFGIDVQQAIINAISK